MTEAEKLFYGGHYAEAIKLYDQVLQIEPDWDRARQHRSESENYLRTGYIPSVALPAEAATAFGKAQSAARLGRYQDAMALLNKAQSTLREIGIQRWQEGQEFEQKLQQNIDAEIVYEEGMKLFAQGQFDEGIDRVETAARATGLPRYNDRVQAMRQVREQLRQATEILNASTPTPKAVARAKNILDGHDPGVRREPHPRPPAHAPGAGHPQGARTAQRPGALAPLAGRARADPRSRPGKAAAGPPGARPGAQPGPGRR